MNRTIIGAIVALAIAALTAVTYIVVSGALGDGARKEAKAEMQPGRLPQQALNNARLDLLNLYSSVEQLAADDGVVATLKADNPSDRLRESDQAFQRFRSRAATPDVLAILDATGNILIMDGIKNPISTELKGKDGKVIWPALAHVLEASSAKRRVVAELWDYPGRGLMRVGVATVVDVETADGVSRVAGAVLVAYAQSSKLAREEARTLGAEVAFFDVGSDGKVFATSFKDAKMSEVLKPVLAKGDLAKTALASENGINGPIEVSAGGTSYYAAALRLPRFPPAKALPEGYPPVTSGVLVLLPSKPSPPAHGTAGRMILILGGVALVLALGAMWLTSRRILDQVDELEVGVAEIINGNLERTFRPVGDDLDGLANGMNVMLARLLGRPEPGEEEMDEDGNPIVSGRVDFDEDAEAAQAAPPADLTALAQEPEPDYYKRVYTEYRDARRAVGNPDEVSFEGFIAKLRVNEGKLKAQHNCKAVRFRVVTKDGKVSLKPVPIF